MDHEVSDRFQLQRTLEVWSRSRSRVASLRRVQTGAAKRKRAVGRALPPARSIRSQKERTAHGHRSIALASCGRQACGGSHPQVCGWHLYLKMSCVPVADDGIETCANCGTIASDTVKLKKCTACQLVKYCGVDCQRAHRKQHKKACKQRAAELKDEQLYGQGLERPEGDFCPICTLPIPLSMEDHSTFNSCCMKKICDGCVMAAKKRGMFDCPFCRTPLPDNKAEHLPMIRARVSKKDPVAINHL
ncbi:hypothetical protein THAOC_21605, partial [Thalassiosira oceanica]